MAGQAETAVYMQTHADGSDLRRRAKPQNPCKGCYFFGGKAEAVKCCNYYLITGKRRPCDVGAGCTVRKDGHQSRKPLKASKK